MQRRRDITVRLTGGINESTAARHLFIPGIDGLRALAVLSIVFFHVNSNWTPGGFVGVDVFFVISGFVVSHSVMDANPESFVNYLQWFYRRRFSRILPAMFTYILVSTAFGVLLLPTGLATKYIEWTGVASVFALGNFLLLWKTGDYFASSAEYNSFTHLWSLAVEEQYYLIFPIFSYWLITRRDSAQMRQILSWMLWIAVFASLIACAWFTVQWRVFAFFMLPTRLWELGLGFLIRLQFDRTWLSNRVFGAASMMGAFALATLAASFIWTPARIFPFPGALPPCLATALLLFVTWHHPESSVAKLLAMAPLRLIGRTSYSLYLWHWGVIVLMRWTVGLDTLKQQLIALFMSTILGLASYVSIEQPLRSLPKLRAAPTLLFFGSYAIAAFIVAATCLGLLIAKPQIGLSVTNDTQVWAGESFPPPLADCAIEESKAPFAYGWRYDIRPACQQVGTGRLYVIGDSHAGTYLRMLRRYAAISGHEVHVFSLAGCTLIDMSAEPVSLDCKAFRQAFAESVATDIREGDTLFLPGNLTARYRDSWTLEIEKADPQPQPSARTVATAVGMSLARLRPLSTKGVTILVEQPKPSMPTALFRCADMFDYRNNYCWAGWQVPRAVMEERMMGPRQIIGKILEALPQSRSWDAMPLLCPGITCEGYRDGKPLYFDTDHLSGYANDLLLPQFLISIN